MTKEKAKYIIIAFLMILCFCLNSCNTISSNNEKEYQKVEHVGEIPRVIRKAVKDNLFNEVTVSSDRILKAEICNKNESEHSVIHKVSMMNIYGNCLAEYTISSDDAYHTTTLTATEDGGFLFVLGFEDYAYGQEKWASDNGIASRIIKCDKDGTVQFDTALEGIEGKALRFCFEKSKKYYFFGTIETPETKKQGIHSPTDIYMCVLNENGEVFESKCIGGSDYDDLNNTERTNDIFLLSIDTQSSDGDFAHNNSDGYPADWVITVNDDLKIIEKKKDSGRDYFDTVIGEKNKKPVFQSDKLFKDFDVGTPSAFIDYGDFYLIVSENIIGEYENTPAYISSIWYYTETVYSGYDKSGKLIFRTAVDSSPDYDAMNT